jgi:hypothetical protein
MEQKPVNNLPPVAQPVTSTTLLHVQMLKLRPALTVVAAGQIRVGKIFVNLPKHAIQHVLKILTVTVVMHSRMAAPHVYPDQMVS